MTPDQREREAFEAWDEPLTSPEQAEHWSHVVGWILLVFAIACTAAICFGIEPVFPL